MTIILVVVGILMGLLVMVAMALRPVRGDSIYLCVADVTARKRALTASRIGIAPEKRRTPESGGQLTLIVSAEEADFILRTRKEQGFLGSGQAVSTEVGFFYNS
jgi:hypothetical protein